MVLLVVFESSTRADQYGRKREKESEKEKRVVFSLSIIAHKNNNTHGEFDLILHFFYGNKKTGRDHFRKTFSDKRREREKR